MKSSRDLIVASLLAFFPVVLIIASLISIPVNHIYNQFKKWYFRGPTDTPQPHYLLDHLTHPSHTRLLSQHNTIQSLFIQLVESILCQLSSVLAIPSREHHPSLYTYSLWISVITLILYSIFQKLQPRYRFLLITYGQRASHTVSLVLLHYINKWLCSTFYPIFIRHHPSDPVEPVVLDGSHDSIQAAEDELAHDTTPAKQTENTWVRRKKEKSSRSRIRKLEARSHTNRPRDMAGQDSDTMLDSCSAHSQGTDLFTHSTDTLAIEQVTAEESPLLIPKQESEWTVVGEKSSKRKAFHAKEEIGHCRLEKELSNVSTPDSTQQNGKYDKEEPICLQSQHQQQQQQSFKKDNAVDTEEALVQVSPVLSPHQQTSHMSIEEEEIALAMEHDSGHRPTTQSNKDSLKVQLDRIEEVKPELDELQQTKARQDIIRTLPLDKKLLVGRRESPTVITQNDSKAEQSDSESTFDDEATDSTWLSLLTPDESLSLVGDEERTEKTLSLLPISDPSLPSSLYNHSKTIHVDTSRLSQRQVPHDKPEQRWYSPFSTGFNLAQLCDDTSKPWDALKTPFVRGSFSESSNFLDVRSKNYTWNKLSHGVHFARKTALDPVFYKKHFSSPGALSHLHHETHLPLPVFSLQSSDKMNSMSLFSQSSSTCMPQRLNKTSEEIGDRKECV